MYKQPNTIPLKSHKIDWRYLRVGLTLYQKSVTWTRSRRRRCIIRRTIFPSNGLAQGTRGTNSVYRSPGVEFRLNQDIRFLTPCVTGHITITSFGARGYEVQLASSTRLYYTSKLPIIWTTCRRESKTTTDVNRNPNNKCTLYILDLMKRIWSRIWNFTWWEYDKVMAFLHKTIGAYWSTRRVETNGS